jgi:hypothetical protein
MPRLSLITPRSATPVVCGLLNPPNGVHIVAARVLDSAGNSSSLTVAGNAISFSLPVATAGTFTVTAVISSLPGTSPLALVEFPAGKPALSFFDDPGTLLSEFDVEVTP